MKCRGNPKEVEDYICPNCQAVNLQEDGKCSQCGQPFKPISSIDLNPKWLIEQREELFCERVK